MKKAKQTRSPYHKNVDRYDDVITGRRWWSRLYMHSFWGVDDNAIAEEVLAKIPDDFSGHLLDIPVGTAVFTCEKYKRMSHTRITGVDYAEPMLEIARSRKEAHGLELLTLSQGDATSLAYADETFDGVLTMNGIHAFPDKHRALSEMARVLKSGGRLYGCTYVTGQRPMADLLVRLVLDKTGLFVPSHYTLESLRDELEASFGTVISLTHHRSIAIFECRKTK